MNLNRKWAFACVLALGTAAGVAAVGCGDDSTTPGGTTDAGKTDSGGKTDAGPGVDSGPGTDSGNEVDAGTVYERLGGRAGIRAFVKDVVEGPMGELSDPKLASYFFIRTPGFSGSPAAAPDPNTIEECFTDLVANAAGGPEQYPTTEDGGFTCRSMSASHAGLHISNGAFGAFIAIAIAKFTAAGVSSADQMTLGTPLLATQTDIVDPARDPAIIDAGGGDANAAKTNYGARCSDIDGGDAAVSPAFAGAFNSSACTQY